MDDPANIEEVKRTTVLLRKRDLENLDKVQRFLGATTTSDAISRALGLAAEIGEHGAAVEKGGAGGEVILQKGSKRERIRFF